MNTLHTPADSGPNAAVRLFGIGATGQRFVQQFHSRIGAPLHTPLADLLAQQPEYIDIVREPAESIVDRIDLQDTRILCLAYGFDMTAAEIEVAMHLVWSMWDREAHVIGIVVGAHDHPPPDGDSMLGILCDSIDARIGIADPVDLEGLAPLQWFYVALQRSVLEGLSILEAAWDHSDVVETLDFGQVQLELFTQSLDEPAQLDAAMVQVLEEFRHRGVWLEQALGAVLVLWAPSEYQLTVRVVRGLGCSLGEALGEGALHLTVRLRSRPGLGDPTAYLTMVVSTPRAQPYVL
ncbi:hypothetical protein EJP67_28175 [Variovorax guangxiensis]|uniref:Tubulin/FtsZ GTPase domain-containing protein n=1 Tax=Variovorax guangxiensis TaxID=1775474 RepID=A0A3S0XJP9_9BURK|nr:hypothetical protein [Variovorax guangxiensis]RUR70942.1 hypothetical protein EJP67_28175 [Variovorax guangxiensis]